MVLRLRPKDPGRGPESRSLASVVPFRAWKIWFTGFAFSIEQDFPGHIGHLGKAQISQVAYAEPPGLYRPALKGSDLYGEVLMIASQTPRPNPAADLSGPSAVV
jgi:hypothetical protein